MPLDGGNSGQMVFPIKANLQDLAVGWLLGARISHGGGMVVRFPRIWMLSGECRLKWSSGKFRFERAGGDQTLVADNNLHPSRKMFALWANTIVPLAEPALLKEGTL